MRDIEPRRDDLTENGSLLPSLDIVYEETEKALGVQFEQVSSLDTKLSILLGAAGITFAALISGRYPLGTPEVATSAKVLPIVAAVLLVVSLVFGFYGYRLFRFERPPNPETLRLDYIVKQPEETKLSIIDTVVDSYRRNQDMIGKKIRFMKLCFLSLSGGVLFLGASFLYNVVVD